MEIKKKNKLYFSLLASVLVTANTLGVLCNSNALASNKKNQSQTSDFLSGIDQLSDIEMPSDISDTDIVSIPSTPVVNQQIIPTQQSTTNINLPRVANNQQITPIRPAPAAVDPFENYNDDYFELYFYGVIDNYPSENIKK